jgi:hypothetical protein
LCQSAHAIEKLAKGTHLQLGCTTKGRGGDWFYVRAADRKTGFVPAVQVSNPEPVHACSADLAVTAALWVTHPDVWNQVHPTAAMVAELKRAYGHAYDFGTDDDWSSDSRAFGALAYLANGNKYKLPLTNPIDTYNSYKSQGKVHTTGTPPTGALVFWHYASSYGYDYGLLGISLGNRLTETAPGFDTQQLPITTKSTKDNIGWVLPF